MSRHTVDTLFRDDQISITKDTVTTGKKKFFTKDIQGVEVKTSFKSIIKITVGLVMTIGMLLGGWLYVIQDGSIGGGYILVIFITAILKHTQENRFSSLRNNTPPKVEKIEEGQPPPIQKLIYR